MRVQTFLLDLDTHFLCYCFLGFQVLVKLCVVCLGIKCGPSKFRLAVVLILRGQYDCSVQAI